MPCCLAHSSLDLSANLLRGSIPDSILLAFTALSSVLCHSSKRHFSNRSGQRLGRIFLVGSFHYSTWTCLLDFQLPRWLSLKRNVLSGTVPTLLAQLWSRGGQLSGLDLSDNNFTGTVPRSMLNFGQSAFDLNCLDWPSEPNPWPPTCQLLRQQWCGAPTDPNQTSILAALSQSTNGVAWINNHGWLDGDPCINEWFGIRCTSVAPGCGYSHIS